MTFDRQSRVGNVRVRGAQKGDLALRVAVSHQLSRLEINPAGLPPSAVLMVRKIKDPLPGRFLTNGKGVRPDLLWERALKDRLEEIYRHAARPDGGHLPGEPDAVVFQDEAELLACLLGDLASGDASRHWWWRLILKSQFSLNGISACMRQLLVEKPRLIPAVMKLLANWRQADRALHPLLAEDAKAVLAAMLHEYDLSHFALQLAPDVSTLNQPSGASRHIGASAPVDKKNNNTPIPTKDAPTALRDHWFDLVPLAPDLGRAQRGLLQLGLMLHQRPHLVRREDFQRFLLQWWHQPGQADPPAAAVSAKPSRSPPGSIPELAGHKAKPVDSDTGKAGLRNRVADDSPGGKIEPHQSTATLAASTTRPLKRNRDQRLGPQAIEISSPLNEHFKGPATGASPPKASTAAESKAEPHSGPGYSDSYVHTRLGGVLYLINLMDQLDLPGCFESGWRLASQFNRWTVLELLARALLDKKMPAYRHDSLWQVLAELAARALNDPIGSDFAGHDTFRLPPSWFEYLRPQNQDFCWATYRKQLRLWSTAGFVLVEMPCQGDSAKKQAVSELRRYLLGSPNHSLFAAKFAQAPLARQRRSNTHGMSKDLARWLRLAIPAVRRVLVTALGLRTTTGRNLVKHLLGCPGRLYITSSHIDFVTDINNTSIRIRKSGLDRDPGWLPEFGRVVQFHYE